MPVNFRGKTDNGSFRVLLHSPPGVCKTRFTEAIASSAGLNMLDLSPQKVISSLWVYAEKWVQPLPYLEKSSTYPEIFEAAFQQAKAIVLSIIFLDEIDAIFASRTDPGDRLLGKVKSTFLTEWVALTAVHHDNKDASKKAVMVFGCTNYPWRIDDALVSRFDSILYVELPNNNERKLVVNTITGRWY